MTPDELVKAYDDEVRGSFIDRLPPGWSVTVDGPLARALTTRGGFAMFVRRPDDLTEHDLEALVERTVAHYAEQGCRFEWKTFDHDREDLRPLLRAHGAQTEPHEALVLGEATALIDASVQVSKEYSSEDDIDLDNGLTLRQVTERDGLERIAAMESEVWGEDWSWLADDLAARLTGTDPVHIFVVEHNETVVSAAWLTPLSGTRVAGLWGGSTLAAYRRRGIYRALVAVRARRAIDLGYEILQVDASPNSQPILERLGLHTVGGTTPYVFESPS